MTAPDLFSRNAPIVANPRWGETFVNRFDLNVRCVGRLMHPVSGEELKVDPRIQAQSFKRSFGEVLQFPVSAGLLKKVRITLAAVRLEEAGIVKTTETPRPADDVLRQISGSSGLDFQEDIFYCVGIFSPVGWPAEWKTHTESRSNVFFYLVEKAEGTFWKIFGSPGPLLDLFDPESQDEKMARARRALGANTRLVIPGDQVAVDSFLEENRLTLGTVEEAIRESRGRFQVIEHKGKSYIQRSIG